jgi:hypothetical protein
MFQQHITTPKQKGARMRIHSLVKSASKSKSRRRLMLEHLESRLLMSVVIAGNGKSGTFTDVDGDLVKIAVTKGTLIGGNFTTSPVGLGDQLEEIDFSGGGFDGANLTFTVKRAATGDGAVNVGYINSTLHDLGAVTLPGDLGRIDAGDATLTTPGIKTLTVRSLGQMGLDSQGGAGDLQSDISALGSLTVNASIKGAFINVTGDITSGIKVAGSIIGNGLADSGAISASGNIGAVKIGFDLIGGDGTRSGKITAGGKITSVTIGGSVIGGDGNVSGYVESNGDMGAVKITGDLRGSTGNSSGVIDSAAKITSVTVGGSLVGGTGSASANIFAIGDIGAVKINGDLVGLGASSAIIDGLEDITSVTIGGSIQGGAGSSSGAVIAGGNVGAIKITGSVVGGAGLLSGSINPNGNITSISIGGSLVGAAGELSGFISADGKIGATTINGSVLGGAGDNSGHLTCNNDISSVKIARDIIGGSGEFSGVVDPDAALPAISVGGSLIGGLGDNSGLIASGVLGTVKITGSLIGGSVSGVDSAEATGIIAGTVSINSITINGSIIAGINTGVGTLFGSGGIVSGNDIKSITVKGSLIGNAVNKVLIVARGQQTPTAAKDEAIGVISVSGRVEYASILAGFDADLNEVNGDAQINTIKIGADFVASTVRAGTTLGADTLPATNDDGIIPGGGAPVSSIASIQIGGQVFGTPDSVDNADHFGFSAQRISAVKIAGKSLTLNPADDTDNIDIGATGDVSILEP